MSKYIIENRSSKDDGSVFDAVKEVIKKGKIANNGKQFCYLTRFDDIGIRVLSRLNQHSHGFVILNKEFGT